jgi:formate-nitrite transporter family protein
MKHDRLLTPVSERDHVLGPDDAPATLLVYGDYECPYTREVQVAVERLRPRLGDAMRYVFRHFPLRPIHPHAQHAAEAAEAAHAQGQFWPMHKALFRHQDTLDDASLLGYAAALGLDRAAFALALRAHEFAPRVQADVDSGAESGVQGTPTLFINGARYRDARSVAALDAALRAAAGDTPVHDTAAGDASAVGG